MIKGLAVTPPVLGRISIGKVVERNGKRLPQKDDAFTITTQVQTSDGWVLHPLDEQLRQEQSKTHSPSAATGKAKLRCIPVKVLFNDPELNLRADYCLFDRKTGRAECVGNGETCRRQTANGMETLPCPSPDHCQFNVGNACKPYGRLNVRIDHGEGPAGQDELGSFVFRTTGYNSIRTLAARLAYLAAVSQHHLATLPLELKLRGKSTTQSHRMPIFYADLAVRTGLSLSQAIARARLEATDRAEAGFDQQALDQAARTGFANGLFEDTAEEGLAVVEEFFAQETGTTDAASSKPVTPTSLAAKLERKTRAAEPAGRTP